MNEVVVSVEIDGKKITEAVLPDGATRLTINLDGRELARALLPYLPRLAERSGRAQ